MLRTLWFNVRYFKQLRINIYMGKKTKVFFKGGKLKISKPVYFDCRNAGQFCYDSTIVLENNSVLDISESVNFFSGAQIKCFESASISIGKNSYFSGPVVIHSKQSIQIGERCSISWNVTILDSNFHALDKSKEISSKEVIIGDDVWIGANVTILKGVVFKMELSCCWFCCYKIYRRKRTICRKSSKTNKEVKCINLKSTYQ